MDIASLKKLRTFLYDAYWPPFAPELAFDAKRGAALCRAAGADSVRFGSIGKYAFYPSKIYPQHPDLNGRDLLQEMIDTGIKVVAYIPVAHGAPGCWVREMYPQWICRDDDGNELEPRGQASHFGGERLLSLCAFGDYEEKILQVVDEILAYDIVAVYLDGPYQGWCVENMICQCPACKARYLRDTGKPLPRNDEEDRWDEYQLWKRKNLLELLRKIHAKAAKKGLPLMMNRTAAAFCGTKTELAMLAEVDCFLIENNRGGVAGASLAHVLGKMIWNYTNAHAHHPRRSDAQFEAATLANGWRTMAIGGSPIVSYAGRFFRSDKYIGYIKKMFENGPVDPFTFEPEPRRFACVFYPNDERLRSKTKAKDESSGRITDMLAARGIPVMELPEALLAAASGEEEWSFAAKMMQPNALDEFKVIFISRDITLTPQREAWLRAFIENGGNVVFSGRIPPAFTDARLKPLDERTAKAFELQRWGTKRYDSYLIADWHYDWMTQTEARVMEVPGAEVKAQSVLFDRQGEIRWDSVFVKTMGNGRFIVFDSPIEQLLSPDNEELVRFFRDVSFMGQTIPFELLEADGPVTACVWKHCVIMTAARKTNVSYRLGGERQDTKVVDGWMGVCLK